MKPCPLSRSLARFPHSTTTTTFHPLASPGSKENSTLPTNAASHSSSGPPRIDSSSTIRLGGVSFSSQASECYTFTEDEHVKHKTSNTTGVGNSSSSSLSLVKHRRQRHHRQKLPRSVSISTDSDQKVTKLNPSKAGASECKLKGITSLSMSDQALPLSPQTTANTRTQSKQRSKKPRALLAASTAAQEPRRTRSSVRNGKAGATSYHDCSTTSGVVISAACAPTVEETRDKQPPLSTQVEMNGDTGSNMKGIPISLSDPNGFDPDHSLNCHSCWENGQEMVHSESGGERLCREHLQSLQPAALDVATDKCGTVIPGVYCESQIMEVALSSSERSQGNVESGRSLPGSTAEHVHAHELNIRISEPDADSALSVISSALGNPKTDSIPTQTDATASGSCSLHSKEAATCVHNDSHESTEGASSSHDACLEERAGAAVGGGGGRKQQQRRGKGRGGKSRGRGRGSLEKDPNESWIRTNSQPLTCDRVGGLLELSQAEQISCSLPDRTRVDPHLEPDTMWEESVLPNMVSDGRSLKRGGLGTRVSFRGRGNRGVRRRRDQKTTTTTTSGRVTRSKTAALLKSKTEEEAEDKETLTFSSESALLLLPPSYPTLKKQKVERHNNSSVECDAECSGDHCGVTIMDISGEPSANTVCGVSGGVTLSDAGAASSVCCPSRDGSTIDALFSTASVNCDIGSKHRTTQTASIARTPREEGESLLFETPSLRATVTMCTTTTAAAAVAGAGSSTAMTSSSSGKPCKSSSPSPPFAQCSSSTTTGTMVRPPAQRPSMQLVCLSICFGYSLQATRVCVGTASPLTLQQWMRGYCFFFVVACDLSGVVSSQPTSSHTGIHTHSHLVASSTGPFPAFQYCMLTS